MILLQRFSPARPPSLQLDEAAALPNQSLTTPSPPTTIIHPLKSPPPIMVMARVSARCDAAPSHYHHHKALLQTRAGPKAARIARGWLIASKNGIQSALKCLEIKKIIKKKEKMKKILFFFFNKEESQSEAFSAPQGGPRGARKRFLSTIMLKSLQG